MRASHCFASTIAIAVLAACAGDDDGGAARGLDAARPELAPVEPTVHALLGARARAVVVREGPSAPFGTLTSTGAGRITCDSLDVTVVIDGRLARTEVTQVFQSHAPRQLEGTYTFTLPAGASIARLAMDVDGEMMEGELVEREKARALFQSIVDKRRDPALLEWEGANRFKTRIFPIPARGTKTIVLAYEELLPKEGRTARYRYALPALKDEKDAARIRSFRFHLEGGDAESARIVGAVATAIASPVRIIIEKQQFVPEGPIEIDLLGRAAESRAWVAHHELGVGEALARERTFLVDWVPGGDGLAGTRSDGDLVLAIDTSASVGDVELARATSAAAALARTLAPARKVMTVFGDMRPFACALAPVAGGAAAGDAVTSCLDGRTAHGASDLGALVGTAFALARELDRARVVLFSDGLPSLGEMDVDLLAARAAHTAKGARATLHTVAVGHAPDEDLLRALARAGEGHALRMTPDDDTAAIVELLAHKIGVPLITDVKVEVKGGGVRDLVPPSTTIARGEPAMVLGRLTGESADLVLSARYLGRELTREVRIVAKDAAPNAMVVRFWARAWIGDQVRLRAPREEVVAASIRYGVMSPFTSFLVLENERMYSDNGIARRKETELRNAATDAAGAPEGFRKGSGPLQAILQRKAAPATAAPNNVFGAGAGISAELLAALEGTNSVGIVASAAPSTATKRAAKENARVRIDDGEVLIGDIDKKTVVGAIRRRGDAFQACYVAALKASPQLRGKVVVEFTIGTDGRVMDAVVVKDGVGSSEVAKCVVTTMKRIKFPPPASGEITFANTFVFDPVGGAQVPVARAALVPPSADDRLAVLFARLDRGEVSPGDFDRVARAMTPALSARLAKRLHGVALRPDVARAAAECIDEGSRAALLPPLVTSWEEAGLAGEALLAVLWPALDPPILVERAFAVASELVTSRRANESVAGALLEIAVTLGRDGETRDLLLRACRDGDLVGAACLSRFVDSATDADRLLFLVLARREAVDDAALIAQMVALLQKMGARSDALRIESEIVELAPREPAHRTIYFDALRSRGEPVLACRQGAAFVQLLPAARDMFRTMMDLARDVPDQGPAIRTCIVEAVSMLPVRRSISAVLTWDDDAADVDLHIEEAAGERVSYAHKESAEGGLLYYDVRTGLGPEIYTLGTAAKGRYRFGVAYYGGTRSDVPATLTLMKNAGAPDETRKVFTITLDDPDPESLTWVGELTL